MKAITEAGAEMGSGEPEKSVFQYVRACKSVNGRLCQQAA